MSVHKILAPQSMFHPTCALICVQLEKQRQEASELTSTTLTKEESLGKLQVEVYRLSSSVSALW